ncbi:HAD family hydrolase [Glycomyces tritici]|uniref:HAD family hydrolase n=1 Tax=Glycomyces tritici TaxID=2665176 RepID=A0ABT7YTA5_9ACTN|nr:HAD family hydrolase [Glycomyces tritici]MDN3241866.1 HAD family hydrolase [Glycomyces tritici]
MPDTALTPAPAEPRRTPPKLVAVDLDGTVVDYHETKSVKPGGGTPSTRPSRAVIDALQAVRDAGVPVAVVTGRAIWGAVRTADDLGLDEGFASASHGAGEYDLGARAISHQATVDAAVAVEALIASNPSVEFAVEWDLEGWWHTKGFRRDFPARWAGEITVEELVSRPAPRLVARVDSTNAYGGPVRCPQAMRLAAGAALDTADYHVEVGYNGWVDIGPPGISKATGIARIAAHYGVSSSDTVVFGDAHNDLTMFAWAGWSVAMGQAAPDVRAAADEVAPSVWEDGVAKVLSRWF